MGVTCGGCEAVNIYVAELDEERRVTPVWIKRPHARSPSIFDPRMHIFDPQGSDAFLGATREDIVNWVAAAQSETRLSH